MKAKSVVQVRTTAGLVDAPCYHQWEQNIGGIDFKFALCVASGHTKGFQAPLAIYELSTGFNIKARLLHPNSHNPLTDKSAEALPSAKLKKLARAAFHRTIYILTGPERFLQAVLGAQMLIAKMEGRIKPDPVVRPAIPYPAPVVMPTTAACLACEDTRVLTTTDLDHEGQPIEVACTECIPAPLPLDHVVDSAFNPVDHLTEDEWFAGLDRHSQLDHLFHKRDQVSESLKGYQDKVLTKACIDRIDSLEDELATLNAHIAELEKDK
jgi:hypothetical protein